MRSLFTLVLITVAIVSCDRSNEPSADQSSTVNETIILETDSNEWHICILATGKLYADAMQVEIPEPWKLPTKAEAQVLRHLNYPHNERFVTSDGHTFSMPSATVSKAGSKTKYSVLGLWRRKTIIEVPF
jgi:hypothetical protein